MSTTSPPRRRFLPQPVETSTRNSKRPHPGTSDESPDTNTGSKEEADSMVSMTKTKRFLPQPVEESARTSRKKNVDHVEHAEEERKGGNSNPVTQSDDLTVSDHSASRPPKSERRFAPEPVETTTRTSRRKFAPEPVETSSRSSKEHSDKERNTSPSTRPRRRFMPEPVETTTKSKRKTKTEQESSGDSPSDSVSDDSSSPPSRRSSGGRKFAPELIETAKGQFRQSRKDSGSSTPEQASPTLKKSEIAESTEPESRFSAAALAKRHHEQHRKHSYCVPNLPIIESDSSEEESTPSLTNSQSDTDTDSHKLKPISEDENGSFTDYVLSLADRKRLQEQAMAAYINEVPHEPVAHFAGEDDDDDGHTGTLSGSNGADPRTFRRSSQDELDLELQSMRRHHEQLEEAKRGLAEDTAGASRFSAAALAARHHLNLGGANKPKPKKNENDEFAKMRAAASPPMLGDEIVFPYTISPKMTRCDVDHPPRPRRADSDEEEKQPEGDPSLWSAHVSVSNNAMAGLWMGLCQTGPNDASRPTTPVKSGLQTPAYEGPNPFESLTPGRGTRTPSRRLQPKPWAGLMPITPPRSADGKDDFTQTIDEKLAREKQIDEEFPNSVITQIYNYLSLGYPSLAKPFDEELSKISRISIVDLRRDDEAAMENAKGYVGAPEGEGSWEEDERGALRGCRRWEALRLYVREWAKQSPTFAQERSFGPPTGYKAPGFKGEAWGATVRRGSWAQ